MLAPTPRDLGLGLAPCLGRALANGTPAVTPPLSLGGGYSLGAASPGTPDTPNSASAVATVATTAAAGTTTPASYSRPPSTRALSLQLGRRTSAASLRSEDGVDVSKLDLRPVCTPPAGSAPLPDFPAHAPAVHNMHGAAHNGQHHNGHPIPIGSPGAALRHRRASSTCGRSVSGSPSSNGTGANTPTDGSSHGTPALPHSNASPGGTPVVAPLPLPLAGAPTLAETGMRLSPDSSHPSGQLERKSPRPRLVRLDSFGGEGLERKPSTRRANLDEHEHEDIPEGVIV
ncbi:hypothetical protein A1Q1_04186 [Trichosporon asahii var. asahii CBS 2479]|uniref:Uncharacterized protein n=1 Tax=Trichosporon asahii var. asahii (strain ATCC 90039 / CBS 2479 / JCM 2466 / KCTC 7840 / NBRC 103889/ NCYC 2677 / UAMH 7654) TaxID=1186058 RepID=J6EW98_TRIAS|nr:hypothetical protein A1Q1_04186 [Trichosporon asahii var. asahii CBS 2479]EJT47077.1 hypothetical protein A1Q1_04186 [Trichosporon asahii var. asahii CBS 2479]